MRKRSRAKAYKYVYNQYTGTSCPPNGPTLKVFSSTPETSSIWDYPGPRRKEKPTSHVHWTYDNWAGDLKVQQGTCSFKPGSYNINCPFPDEFPSSAELIRLSARPLPNPSRADVVDRLVNPAGNNFFETAASITEIKGLFDTVVGMGNALRFLPRSLILAKNQSKRLPQLRRYSRSAGLGYLTTEFGFKQLYEDVKTLRKQIPKVARQLRRFDRLEGRIVRVGFRQRHNVSFTRGELRVRGSTVTRLTYKVRYTRVYSGFSTNPGRVRDATKALSGALDYMGLHLSAKGAWEILPGSWLIDQVLPVKDLLSDFGNARNLLESDIRVEYLGFISSSKADLRIWNTKSTASTSSYKVVPSERTFSARFEYYQRSVGYRPPDVFTIRNRTSPREISKTGKVYSALKLDSTVKRFMSKRK